MVGTSTAAPSIGTAGVRVLPIISGFGPILSREIGQRATVIGAAFGTALAAPLGLAAGAAIRFEDAFAGVRKTVDLSDEAFDKLEKSIREMATEIPVTVEQLSKFGAIAGQLGIQSAAQIEKFIETIARLSVAVDGISAEDAATNLARFINVTGRNFDDVDKLASGLVQLGNEFNATEGEILHFSQLLAGSGTVIGLTQANILGLATTLASAGIAPERAGSAFSRLFLTIGQAADAGGEKLEAFAAVTGRTGASFAAFAKATPVEAIREFLEGFRKIATESPAKAIGVLKTLGLNTERVRDVMFRSSAALRDFSASQTSANEAIENGSALFVESEERFKTTASQIQLLKNIFNELGIIIGEKFLPGINFVIGAVKAFVEFISAIPPGILVLGTAFAAVTGTIIAFGSAFIYAGQHIAKLFALRRYAKSLGGFIPLFRQMASGIVHAGDGAVGTTVKLGGLGAAAETTGVAFKSGLLLPVTTTTTAVSTLGTTAAAAGAALTTGLVGPTAAAGAQVATLGTIIGGTGTQLALDFTPPITYAASGLAALGAAADITGTQLEFGFIVPTIAATEATLGLGAAAASTATAVGATGAGATRGVTALSKYSKTLQYVGGAALTTGTAIGSIGTGAVGASAVGVPALDRMTGAMGRLGAYTATTGGTLSTKFIPPIVLAAPAITTLTGAALAGSGAFTTLSAAIASVTAVTAASIPVIHSAIGASTAASVAALRASAIYSSSAFTAPFAGAAKALGNFSTKLQSLGKGIGKFLGSGGWMILLAGAVLLLTERFKQVQEEVVTTEETIDGLTESLGLATDQLVILRKEAENPIPITFQEDNADVISELRNLPEEFRKAFALKLALELQYEGNTPEEALAAIETLFLEAGIELPVGFDVEGFSDTGDQIVAEAGNIAKQIADFTAASVIAPSDFDWLVGWDESSSQAKDLIDDVASSIIKFRNLGQSDDAINFWRDYEREVRKSSASTADAEEILRATAEQVRDMTGIDIGPVKDMADVLNGIARSNVSDYFHGLANNYGVFTGKLDVGVLIQQKNALEGVAEGAGEVTPAMEAAAFATEQEIEAAEKLNELLEKQTDALIDGAPVWGDYGEEVKVNVDDITNSLHEYVRDMNEWAHITAGLAGFVSERTLEELNGLSDGQKVALSKMARDAPLEFERLIGHYEQAFGHDLPLIAEGYLEDLEGTLADPEIFTTFQSHMLDGFDIDDIEAKMAAGLAHLRESITLGLFTPEGNLTLSDVEGFGAYGRIIGGEITTEFGRKMGEDFPNTVAAIGDSTGAVAEAEEIGEKLGDGVGRGFSRSDLDRIFLRTIQRGLATVRTRYGIESPSTVTANELGLPLGQGVALGISRSGPEIVSAFSETLGLLDDEISPLIAKFSGGNKIPVKSAYTPAVFAQPQPTSTESSQKVYNLTINNPTVHDLDKDSQRFLGVIRTTELMDL